MDTERVNVGARRVAVYARRVSRPRSRLALALVLVLMYGAAVGAKPSAKRPVKTVPVTTIAPFGSGARLASAKDRREVLQSVPPAGLPKCLVVTISVLPLSDINPAHYAGVRSCGAASDGSRKDRKGRPIAATFGLILQKPEESPYWTSVISGTRLGTARCAHIVAQATDMSGGFIRRNVLYDLDLTFFAMGCARETLYGAI